MGIKKIGYSTHSVIYTLIVLGILAVINIIFIGNFYRLDLTENKIFSISKATKDVLKKLDDMVNIQIFFTKEEKLPPQLIELKRQVTDIIDEYTAYGGSHLTIEFIDPEDDPDLAQRMQFMGIPKVQVNIIQKDKAEVAAVYLGMSIMFEDRNETIPVIQNVRTLEYDLTSAILKVIKKEPETVGFVSWNKETLQQDPFSDIQRSLQKQYDVKNINLSSEETILKDIDTLIAITPEEVTDKEKTALDQFLMQGGKEIYLVDMIRLKTDKQLEAENVNTNITDFLAHYGFQLTPDLVLDISNSMAAFSGGFFHFQMPYPFWPKVQKDGFDQTSPIVSKLDTITFPWTSSVRIKDNIIKEKGLKASVLAQTTPHGWIQRGRYNLNPQQNFNVGSITRERVPLAVMISGVFESFSAKGEKDAQKDPNIVDEDVSIISEKETNIVVIGNSRFIQNDFLSRFRENEIFFLNLVDWLTMGDKLIGIRSRERTERPLPEMSDAKKAMIRYINIIGVSILLIFFGLIKFILKRRKRARAYES